MEIKNMSNSNVNEILKELVAEVEGAIVATVVDASSGMIIGSAGSGFDIELAAAGNCQVVRAKLNTMKSLKLDDSIEDILITLGKQYHIIRPTEKYEGMFVYLVIDRNKGNLALARRHVLLAEGKFVF
jgi:predicted regulator of Ras-like GTPase activity (Roadblock/LC7/MglB family)